MGDALATPQPWRWDAAWYVTRHAQARWQERYEPGASPSDVGRRLAEISRDAIDTGARTRDGREIYLHPDWPAARFVVARPAPGETMPALITVIDAAPARDKRESRTRWRRRRG